MPVVAHSEMMYLAIDVETGNSPIYVTPTPRDMTRNGRALSNFALTSPSPIAGSPPAVHRFPGDSSSSPESSASPPKPPR
jgi:hypothetical protein